MNNLKVTVIIPAKNEELIIGKCLSALKNIDYPQENFEVIVVDNGSTDSTLSIVESHGFTACRQPALTIAGLRNYGAGIATCDVLAFVDADVIVEPDWLRNGIAALMEDGVACAGCSPEIPANATWVEKAWSLQIKCRPEKCYREWLASMNLLVWKRCFDHVQGFNPNLHTCEDVDFGYRIGARYRIVSDKKIRAVHYGEAKTLRQLFKKESWRGISNFQGIMSHGLVLNEIPSHLLALYYFTILTLVPFIFLIIPVTMKNLAIVLLLIVLYPLLKALNICGKLKTCKPLLQVVMIWIFYCLARGWSLWRVAFRKFNWAYAR